MKKMRTNRIVLLVSIGFMLAGCTSSDPDCASKDTLAAIKNILLNQDNIFKLAVIDEFPIETKIDPTYFRGVYPPWFLERAVSAKGRAYFSKNASYLNLISLYDVEGDEFENVAKKDCKDVNSDTCLALKEKVEKSDQEWDIQLKKFFYINFLNSPNYMNYTLSNIRTQSKASDTKAVSCAATLILWVPDLYKGSKDITYKVELNSDREIYVSVYGIVGLFDRPTKQASH